MLERQLIQNGTSRIDDTRLPQADDTTLPADDGHAVVNLATWLEHRGALRARQHPVGIALAPDDEALDLAETESGTIDPTGIAFIAVEFPNMTDGRGFSQGQLLRTRLGWEGEMRAVGDVLADTMFYLSRCGFDSFSLKPGQDADLALRALSTFSTGYQRGYRLGNARA